MNYHDRFDLLPNAKLFEVIIHSHEFDISAVNAAKEILRKRNISEDELSKIEELTLIDENTSVVHKKILSRLKNYFVFNEHQEKRPQMWIFLLSGVFGSWFLYRLLRTTILMWPTQFTEFDSASLMVLFYAFDIIPVVVVVLFFLRKKIGWYLFTVCLMYLLMNQITWILEIIRTSFAFPGFESDIAEMVSVFDARLYIQNIAMTFFFVFGFWAVLRRDVREIFHISQKQMWILISATALFYILILLLIMLIYL